MFLDQLLPSRGQVQFILRRHDERRGIMHPVLKEKEALNLMPVCECGTAEVQCRHGGLRSVGRTLNDEREGTHAAIVTDVADGSGDAANQFGSDGSSACGIRSNCTLNSAIFPKMALSPFHESAVAAHGAEQAQQAGEQVVNIQIQGNSGPDVIGLAPVNNAAGVEQNQA